MGVSLNGPKAANSFGFTPFFVLLQLEISNLSKFLLLCGFYFMQFLVFFARNLMELNFILL